MLQKEQKKKKEVKITQLTCIKKAKEILRKLCLQHKCLIDMQTRLFTKRGQGSVSALRMTFVVKM